MPHVSGIATDNTWYVTLGKELFRATHLVLPGKGEAHGPPLKYNLP